eukprot:6285214-Amphidinium_carterae.1
MLCLHNATLAQVAHHYNGKGVDIRKAQYNPDSFHLDMCAFQFDMVAEIALTMSAAAAEGY